MSTHRPRKRTFWRWMSVLVVLTTLGAYLEAGFAQKAAILRYDSSPSVVFSHAKHPQDCGVCHTSKSHVSSDDLGPSEQVCATCHGGDVKPEMHTCSGCHLGASDAEPGTDVKDVRPAPFVAKRVAPDIRFSHQRHAAQPCATCHANGVSPEPHLPRMQVCTDCHAAMAIPNTCETCHTTPVQPKPARVRPDSHAVDWLKRHGTLAATYGQDCMSCHQPPDCASCHTAQMGKPYAIHPPNFVTIHAVDARADQANCATCHSVQNFCTACHVRSEVTARVDARPPSTVSFHPPGFVEGRTPNNHGVMARRNIVECASCHTERDCVSCHTAINPHPADFRLECRSWLDANPRPCAQCHTEPAALRAQCL